MKKKTSLLILIPMIMIPALQITHAGEEETHVHISPLEKSIYRITYTLPYTFVHLASIGEDGIFLIDTGVENTAQELLHELKKIATKETIFVLNTHAHQDHIGGNPVFAGEATILSHINVRKRYFPPDSSLSAHKKKGEPTISFKGTINLYMNGQTIIIKHVPSGHTDGDSIVYFPESRLLYIGDLIIPGRFSTVDLELGGDVDGFLMNLKDLIAEYPDDTRYIPTHGNEHTKDALRYYYNAFVETYAPIKEALEQGKTIEQIVESSIFDNYRNWLRKEYWVEVIRKQKILKS
jgi:glyoxylase-like metal-dependent hydrolase (beta-lactamase superfamily II)